jgi:hypothetical protein
MPKRRKRKGESWNVQDPRDVRRLFDGSRWAFLCFTPDRGDALQAMLADLIIATGKGLKVVHVHFPPGVLWNKEECHAIFVPKASVDREAFYRALREHLGYERPDASSDVFTLGVKPEDDAELDRVGLFSRR